MKKLALCIGINDYPGYQNDLQGCVADANDWAAAFSSRGFQVVKLLDKQATRSNIIAAVKTLMGSTVSGDSILIQNSSHGTQVPDENGDEIDSLDEATCPYDLPNLIYDDEWWSLFKLKKPGVQLMMFSDSCHSGSVCRAFSTIAIGKPRYLHFGNFAKDFKPREITPDVVSFDPAADEKSPWPCGLMGGCQDTEYSYDANFGGKPNGAFTYWALKTLAQLNSKATYQDWYNAICKELPSRQYPQTPTLLGSYKTAKVLS
jgi:hypothetical protein